MTAPAPRSSLMRIVAHDWRRHWQAGAMIVPVAFILLVATLFAFAIGPDRALLGRIAGGVLWTATLLAALLPVDRLIRPDHENGTLAQYAARDIVDEHVALAKWLAHWLGFAPAIMLAALPAMLILSGRIGAILPLIAALCLASGALAAIAVIISALTASLRANAALTGMLMLPLAIPVLIFGAGAADPVEGPSAFKLLAATCLFLIAVMPFVTAVALRGLRR